MSRLLDKLVLSMVVLFTLISITKLDVKDYALILTLLVLTIVLAYVKKKIGGGRVEFSKEASS